MSRTMNVLLVAFTVEVQCPHCGACQPSPDGSEFCEISEARAMCDGATKACSSCDEPIRMLWQSKAQVPS